MSDELHEDDREAILSRRSFLIESALVNAGLAAACTPKEKAEPQVCLSQPIPAGANGTGKPQSPQSPTDASGSSPDKTDVPWPPPPGDKGGRPRVCLKVRPPREPTNPPKVPPPKPPEDAGSKG